MDGISPIERTEFSHDEPPESHTLPTSQLKGNGNHHFKAVNIIVYPIVLPDVPLRFTFQQFHVFVDGVYSLAYVAAEHIERIGHLLLRHPYGSGRHSDHPCFSDCDYSSFHSSYIALESTFRTLFISRRMELSSTRA